MQSKPTLTGSRLVLTSALLGLLFALGSHGGALTYAQNSTSVLKPEIPQVVQIKRSYRLPRKGLHLRGPQFFMTQQGEDGPLTLHSAKAFKRYKKLLKKDQVILKDVRPYDEAHPIANKIQVGSARWSPVAQVSSYLMGPAAMLGAGKLAESNEKVVVQQ